MTHHIHKLKLTFQTPYLSVLLNWSKLACLEVRTLLIYWAN